MYISMFLVIFFFIFVIIEICELKILYFTLTGKVEWPTHTIISKETRLWLGIDDESCKTATADLDQTILNGMRTLTNLSAQEQWLSMHQCIDDKCPVHHDDKYSKPAAHVNEEDDFQIKEIKNDSSKSHENNKSRAENAKCRRQLFVDDGSAMQKIVNAERDGQLPVKKPSNALNYSRLDDLASDISPANQESITHDHAGNNLRLSKHITNDSGFSQTSEPRFMCSWLNEHVSIDTYPQYKLSVLCAGTNPIRRTDFGVFSTYVTNLIWTSHKYLGDVDNEILESDKTPNSTCLKAKSLECCLNETTANVLKDICDVDISDIKTKYNFLFDPMYVFQTTEITKHAGMKRLGGQGNDIIQQCHGDSENKVVSGAPVDTYAHDHVNDTKFAENADYVALTNNTQYSQTRISPRFHSESQTMGPFAVHHYLKENTTNFFSSLTDPRLNKTRIETNCMNGNTLCCQNCKASPDMCSKVNHHVMSESSKDKWYVNNSDESLYNMSSLSMQNEDALNPYLFTEQILNRDNRVADFYSSTLVDGDSRNQTEPPLTHVSDYSGSSELEDYFSRFKQKCTYQSPFVETCYATTVIHPDDQQCLRSPKQFDERHAKDNHCDILVSNSSGRSPYQNKKYERSTTTTLRSTCSQDRIRSRGDRPYKTGHAKCDDDLRIRSNSCSTLSRHRRCGYRSYDERSEEEYYEQQTKCFKSHKANYEDKEGVFNPIPRYLMDIVSQEFAKQNNSLKRISSPQCTSTRSSYEEYWSPSRDKNRSEDFRLGYSSRDRIPRDVSRPTIGQTSSVGKYLNTVGLTKSGYSEQYLRDRQRRSEHRYRRERKSTSLPRYRARSRSGVAHSPRSKTLHSPKIMSGSRSRQLIEHKECKRKLKFGSSMNRSYGRNMDRPTSVGQRRYGDLRART